MTQAARKRRERVGQQLDPWMTRGEAARRIGIAKATVSNLAMKGQLETQIVAGQIFVSRASVEKYVANKQG